ncbi:MAG: hypothetical protein MI748_13965 [Opitutales bacterium]|nr:hypothetical protein [Opitutales bacterium]
MTKFVKLSQAFALALTSFQLSAFELDWDQVDWSAGATSQTFTNVNSSGIDITISTVLSNDWYYHSSNGSGYWARSNFIGDAPDDDQTFGGDWAAQNGESLYLGVNFATDDPTRSYLDVTVSFSQSVTGTSFQLFDVDRYYGEYYGGYEYGYQFEDVIFQIEGSNGGSAATTTVTYDDSKIDQGTMNSSTAYFGDTRRNSIDDQNDNPASVLTIGWNDPIDQFSFRYASGPLAAADPGNQAIGLSNIGFYEYSAVPEPSTYLSGGLIILVLAGMAVRKRFRRQQTS